MNVYDSHRMADTLAPAGFSETARARRRRPRHPQHLPHPREGGRKGLFRDRPHPRHEGSRRPPKAARCMIAVAGCVAQAEGEEIIRRAGSVDLVVGSQNYHRLPELVARAASGEKVVDTEFPVEDKFEALGGARARSDAQARHFGFRHRAGRLRQVLHLLRGALYARRGSLAAGGADRRRSGAAGRRRRARGDADRAERQRLSRAGRRRRAIVARQAAAAAGAACPALRACATPPAIRATWTRI